MTGEATIKGVTISDIVPPPTPTTSDALKELFDKKRRLENSCERANKSLNGLETYLGSLDIQHLAVSNLLYVMHSNDMAAEDEDDRIAAETDEAISVEKARLSSPVRNPKLNLKVIIDVDADFESSTSIFLFTVGLFFLLTCLLLLIWKKNKCSRIQCIVEGRLRHS